MEGNRAKGAVTCLAHPTSKSKVLVKPIMVRIKLNRSIRGTPHRPMAGRRPAIGDTAPRVRSYGTIISHYY